MEKCPFWSTKNSIVTCNKECPMHDLEGLCGFQILSNGDSIESLNESEFEELEYIIN